jgi:RHH-type rel operon transcriptional repressor/antitoxin RelB
VLALRLPKDLDEGLAAMASRTGRTKSYYAKKAIAEFLEDQADLRAVTARLGRRRPSIPLDEVERRLGLERRVRPRRAR